MTSHKKSSFYGAKSTKLLPTGNKISNKSSDENKIMFERYKDRIVPTEKRRKLEPEIHDDDDDFAELIRLYKKKKHWQQ